MSDEYTYINGRFLTQNLSGVQRFARELTQALDAELENVGRPRFILLTPPGHDQEYASKINNIELELVGGPASHVWDQIFLQQRVSGGRLVNLCGTGPIINRRQVTVIHDAAVYRAPENFSPLYGRLHRFIGRRLAKTSRIATVSHFSQGELSDVLHIADSTIDVLPNGADHLSRVVPDGSVVERLGLVPARYFLTVGNLSRNKNLVAALNAFRAVAADNDYRMVVVGAASSSSLGPPPELDHPRLVMAGRLSDEELAGLYLDAAALIYPSRYEGFGIPPVEALYYGCPVIASDIPAVREVCADAISYFRLDRPEELTALLANRIGRVDSIQPDSEIRKAVLQKYTWGNTAKRLLETISSL